MSSTRHLVPNVKFLRKGVTIVSSHLLESSRFTQCKGLLTAMICFLEGLTHHRQIRGTETQGLQVLEVRMASWAQRIVPRFPSHCCASYNVYALGDLHSNLFHKPRGISFQNVPSVPFQIETLKARGQTLQTQTERATGV